MEVEFWRGFANAFVMLIVTEFGDATFVLAAIMAASASRTAIFAGNMLAMTLMTCISVGIGKTVFLYLPVEWVQLLSAGLFLGFSMWSFWLSRNMKEGDDDSSSDEELRESLIHTPATTSFFRALWQSLVVTIAAEWGDRSQLGTAGLAGTVETFPLILGCLAGLAVMTALSVVVGGALVNCVDKRTILVASGLLFLSFSIHALFEVRKVVEAAE